MSYLVEKSDINIFKNQIDVSDSKAIKLLKKQIAEETKEKYALYKRIKELNEELNALKNRSSEMSTDSGPDYIQRVKT